MPNSPCRARQGGKSYIGQLFALPPVDSPFDLQDKTGMPSSPNPCAQAIQLVLPSAYRSSAERFPQSFLKLFVMLNLQSCRLHSVPLIFLIFLSQIVGLRASVFEVAETVTRDISGVPNHQGNLEPLKPHAGSPEPQPNLALLSETHPPQDTPRPWVLPKQVQPADQSLTEQRFADKLGVTDFIKPDHPRPAYINEFRDQYLAAIGSESQLKLVEDELKKILGMNQIEYGMGMNWLKAFEGICQTQEDVNSELRMNTLVSFSYRNLMSKPSDPHTVPSPEHEQLHGFIVKLEKDRELYYQGKFWSNVKVGQNRGKNLERKLTMRQVDWSQEALFPYMGLGNTERVKTFKGMIERNPAIERYFGEARKRPYWSVLLGKHLTFFENKLLQRNEAKFIQSLARTVNRANVETDSQTKTASIVLLLQLKAKGGEGL
ncbi:hypothetical protein Pst134EA_032468 [Puccinia striiformis f. sp. tritici]|uniref:uncharacterized protein n=1 Tax=Puccinia striiformis f. sp. tritici TaxID=168172 RepID=UPI0020086750|nr:uncharacterized protein Pst134EA_032468 [Puccinia striiformis f. sp. tritici]KAH9440697.1 hypothetical protein Pst134EA_032468 [Puccinia striiformis f. sp. tritici]